jgi:hypothetical protein
VARRSRQGNEADLGYLSADFRWPRSRRRQTPFNTVPHSYVCASAHQGAKPFGSMKLVNLELVRPKSVDRRVGAALDGSSALLAVLEWLRLQNQISENLQGQEPKQLAEPTVEATPVREPAKQAVPKREFTSPYRGAGWPYKVEKKRKR